MNKIPYLSCFISLLFLVSCSQEDTLEVEETAMATQSSKAAQSDESSRTARATYPKVIFQSARTGRYLSSENGKRPMRLDRSEVFSWERFTVLDLGNNHLALRGNNGLYVNSENGERPLTCYTPERRSWEVFRLIQVGKGQYILQGNNGRYVSTDGEHYLWSTASREEAERFTVRGLPPMFRKINSLQTIKDDMTLPHEGYPNGVPESTGWTYRPRVGEGNEPPEPDWSAVTAWGQVYVAQGERHVQNVRFQLRNMQAWYLSKRDGQWKKWQYNQDIRGALYVESFAEDRNKSADIRDESANGGGISSVIESGYNFHFWPAQRASMDPSDIAGTWITTEARLIVDDPTQPDRRDQSRWMLSVGGDYWKTIDAQWDQWTTNRDFGIGRFKFITSEWQAFNMHTLTEEQLKNNPPPFR